MRFAAVQWVAEVKAGGLSPSRLSRVGSGRDHAATVRSLPGGARTARWIAPRAPKEESSGDKYVLRLAQDPQTPAAVRARALRSLQPDNPALTTAMLLTLMDAEDLANAAGSRADAAPAG